MNSAVVEWTTDLTERIYQAMKSKGVNHCPACASEDLLMAQGFIVTPWTAASVHDMPRSFVYFMHEDVYVKLICGNCGFRMYYQFVRLMPPEPPKPPAPEAPNPGTAESASAGRVERFVKALRNRIGI